MVPHIAPRGHSFKGAGLYYLHDKQADTAERVAWTHTHNLPTQDPDKAMKWMAFTAMHADQIKEQAGVPLTGRKAKAGSVYSFSLAWHPEQDPQKEKMVGSALETMELLGLKDHQAVIVAHQETEHPHIHVICNLVNPENGRTAVPSYDRLKLSKWAEEQERIEGKIYCEQRVENNKQRREKAQEGRDLALVKHREEKLERAEKIKTLYERSDSGRAFNAALQEAGYTLAKGDRRGFVLVDGAGNIHSLSRQLKGQRAKDIKTRLADIDQAQLPQAKTIAEERRYFDRDQYEIDRQKGIVDAAIDEEKAKEKQEDQNRSKNQDSREKGQGVVEKKKTEQARISYDDSHLIKLDKQRALEAVQQRRRDALERQLEEFYNRKELSQKLDMLQKEIEKSRSTWSRLTGKTQKLEEERDALEKSLTNIDSRINEQRSGLEAKIKQEQQRDQCTLEQAPQLKPESDKRRQERIEMIRKRMLNNERERTLGPER